MAVVGSALALSPSAFALRLLRDRDDEATAHGRAALGVLLAQNLAVATFARADPGFSWKKRRRRNGGQSGGCCRAKPSHALATVELVGKHVMNSLFFMSAQTKSQEAFLAVVLLNVLGNARGRRSLACPPLSVRY